MKKIEVEKSKVFRVIDVLDYLPHSIVIKSILRKSTGTVAAVSFDSGEVLTSKTSPFDTFIQIIEGQVDVIIDDHANPLQKGESIIIPAHTKNSLRATVCCKMISTVIKSGYEEVIL